MPKTTDNKIKKEGNQQSKQDKKQVIDQPQVNANSTPHKKQTLQQPENIFNMMTPFQLPPKLTNHQTAATQGFSLFSNDMRMIETPLNNKFNKLDVAGIQDDMHDNLRAISSKIDWGRTPGKSSCSENSFQEEGEAYSEISEQDQVAAEDSQKPEQKEKQEKQSSQQVEPIVNKLTSKVTLVSQKKKSKLSQSKQVPEPNVQHKKVFCNCKKTKCLKLYCDCFRINQTCDGCNCSGCHNLDEYADERNNAILVLMDRNPDPFSQKIQADKHLKGCNCKKSGCMKKYCECYQANLKCGQNCKCQECKNGGGACERARQASLKMGGEQTVDKKLVANHNNNNDGGSFNKQLINKQKLSIEL